MQKRPITIALVLAGVIAGTTAGIAAVNSDISSAAQPVALQPASQAPSVEAQAATEMQPPVAVAAETPAPAAEPVSQVAQAPTMTPPPMPTAAAPVAPPARSYNDEKMVRIPFTNRYVRVTYPTFPSDAPETPNPLPSTIAYFDRLEATRLAASQPAPAAPVAAMESPVATAPMQPATQTALAGN